MGLLRDSIWQFIGVIVAVIFGLVSIMISIVLALKQQKHKEIFFDLLENTALSSFNITGKLKMPIMFEDEQLEDVNLIYVKVWNEGNTEILPDDYHSPIKFEFGEQARVLEASVTRTIPDTLKDKVAIKWDSNSLSLDPLLLNTKDTIYLKVLVTQYEGDITADGRIAGVDKVKDLREIELSGVGYIASLGWALKDFLFASPVILPGLVFFIIMLTSLIIITNTIGTHRADLLFGKIFFYFMSIFTPVSYGLLTYLTADRVLKKRKVRYNSWILLLVSFIFPVIMFFVIFFPLLLYLSTH